MSVMIRGEDCTRLRVTGDIEAELAVPQDEVARCWISLSDGTLVEAVYGADDRCRFTVSEEGAGIARIQHVGDSDVLRLDWRVEWVAIAAAGNAARATAPHESLPLIPGLLG
ncbi:MAG: hypothetical protein WCY29_10155 [Novosphingobium sp.]